MKNVVPFQAPPEFAQLDIEWTRAARTKNQRTLREAFLRYETSCGPNGRVWILLLAIVSKRQGSVAEDLLAAARRRDLVVIVNIETLGQRYMPTSK